MALVHLAEGTTPGTGRPHQQKRRRPAGVAFAPVGAAALLANGVDVALLDDLLHLGDFAGPADRGLEPAGQGFEVGGVGEAIGIWDEAGRWVQRHRGRSQPNNITREQEEGTR